ncbi:fam-h protein [Plasmodium relictum]|uniref:Fam-h protein n=1 Tax=Plasmodium relictum TaxID=85471 RepID=A0A1J1GK95_PLARL|nr:fam-h protein [Plasmodium relictum]CRG83976.1 fam-h protein [Plasmodium relictum]
MNKKNNIIFISNYRMHPRYYSHVTKGFTTTDMSTLEIYIKKEKTNILYFLIKFFIFTISIWILQCSNTLDSYRSWNYKNDLKNILDLGPKRSLAESNDTIEQTKSKLRLWEQQDMMEAYLESKNEQNEIKQNMDVEQGNEMVTKERNNEVKCNKKILSKCKSNLKLIFSSFAFFSSLFIFILFIVNYFTFITFPRYIFLLLPLSLVINSIILTHERVEIKYKNKF